MNDAQLLLDRVSDQDLREAYQDRFTLKAGEVLDNSRKVADHLATLLAGRTRETFAVCFLTRRNALLSTEILFEGTLTQAVIFPREIVKYALLKNAAAIICGHNHPSGEVKPSADDKAITRFALEKGYLKTTGKTPHSTAHAQIAVDIKNKGEKSRFKRIAPGIFALRDWAAKPIKDEVPDWQITPKLSSKQKGDMAENRVAELIQLYGEAALSCYKPVSDDEGIDLIVKRKGATLQSHYIQVKSRFLKTGQAYLQTPATNFIVDSYHMSLVFVYFDLEVGDIGEYLWFIPAPDFIREAPKIPANPAKKRKERYRFNASTRNPTEGKWGEYAISKRALADAIVELMEKVQ